MPSVPCDAPDIVRGVGVAVAFPRLPGAPELVILGREFRDLRDEYVVTRVTGGEWSYRRTGLYREDFIDDCAELGVGLAIAKWAPLLASHDLPLGPRSRVDWETAYAEALRLSQFVFQERG